MQRFAAFPVVYLLAAAGASEIRPAAAPEIGSLTTRFAAVQAIPASDGTHRKSVNVSLDGRFVAFESDAPLAPQDTNRFTDVYALDRITRIVTLESISAVGGASDGSSRAPVLSADGRYLVFESDARNLEAVPDGNSWADVFLRDRQTQRTRRISIGAAGEAANGLSGKPTISADGKTIAFVSTATNLLPGRDANGSGTDVYLFRVQTGALSRGSVGSDGVQPAVGESLGASLSGDGRFVAFVSTADLDRSKPYVGRSRARGARTFVRDTLSQTTECIDAALRQRHAEGFSYHPTLSADARSVAFVFATARPDRPTRVAPQVYLYDRVHSTLLLVSRTMRGSPADGPSSRPALSADGRVVTFQSLASNLGCGRDCPSAISDLNLLPDVYLFDAPSRRMVRLSRGLGEWWVPSVGPAIDGSGRVVAFSSRQPRDPKDIDSAFDLYVSAADERE